MEAAGRQQAFWVGSAGAEPPQPNLHVLCEGAGGVNLWDLSLDQSSVPAKGVGSMLVPEFQFVLRFRFHFDSIFYPAARDSDLGCV